MGTLKEALSLSTAAVAEPVTVAECKEYLDVDYTAHDTLIGTLISAATEAIEREINRDIMERTWAWSIDDFPSGDFLLPKNPVQSISSITYNDTDGNSQTLATSVYAIQKSEPPKIYLQESQTWPSTQNEPQAVTVTFVTGYAGTADSPVSRADVPEALRIAIMMTVRNMYDPDQPGPVLAQLDKTALRLIRPYRVHWL